MRSAILVTASLLGGCGGPAAEPAAPAAPERAAPAPGRGAIGGLVRDQGIGGRPLSFAEVVAVSTDPPVRAADVSDAAGRYRVNDLEPGRYRVTASFAQLRVSYDDVLVEPGRRTRVNIDFDSRRARERAAEGAAPEAPAEAARTGAIFGRVVDEIRGEPLYGAAVSALHPRSLEAPITVTDESGHYRLVGLEPGTYTLSIYYQLIDRGSIELRRTGVIVEAGGTTRIDLEIDTRAQR